MQGSASGACLVDVAYVPARDPAGGISCFAQAGENKVWAETVEAEVGPTDRSILMMTSMHECQRQRWSSSYGYYSYNQAGLGE